MASAMFHFSFAFFSALLANMTLAVICGMEQYGYHPLGAVTHLIVVAAITFVHVGAMYISRGHEVPSMFVYHWRQVMFLSVYLLALGGFLHLYEDYSKFGFEWSSAKVRTAPPHELAVENTWRQTHFVYLCFFALTTPEATGVGAKLLIPSSKGEGPAHAFG